MKFFYEMTDEELAQVDLIQFTNLKIGDRVRHYHAGKSAGSAGIIPNILGTVIGHHNQGLYHWGGLCVTVDVKWDNGETYSLVYKWAIKESV